MYSQMERLQTSRRARPEIMADRQALTFKSPSEDKPVLAEIVCRLVALYHPERICLFGSTAQGLAGPHSDYDILVVVSDDTPVELRETDEVYQVLWEIGAPVDVLVWTRSDFEGRLHLKASLPFLEDALFHCQQAVEKALKGFLTWHDRPFEKTHDLGAVFPIQERQTTL